MGERTLHRRMETHTPSEPHDPEASTRGRAAFGWRVRVVPAAVLIITVTLLGTALGLEADPSGISTHRQLGLPPCGFLISTGLPCATCGMTTAFTHAVHGRLVTAFLTQPGGFVFAVLSAVATLICLYAMIVGAPLLPLARWLWRPATVWLFGTIVIASWVYKSILIVYTPA